MLAFGVAALVSILAATIVLTRPGQRENSGLAVRTTHTSPPKVTSTGTEPPSTLTIVPDVRGLTVSKARARIVAAGLRLVGLISTLGRPGVVEGVVPSPLSGLPPGHWQRDGGAFPLHSGEKALLA